MRNLCVRTIRLAISVVFLLLIAPLGGLASSSEITGRVLDPSGAVIVEVQVTATNVATNIKRTTTTNEQGIYRFLHLAPGEYNLRVSYAGFRATDVLGIVVHVTQTAEVNVTLRLGSVVQTVTVEGGEIFLNTQGAEVGTVVNRQFVENLPMNGRSFHALLELTPGVVLTKASADEQGQFSVNGQRANANYFMVDGVSANAGTTAVTTLGQHGPGSLPALTAFGGTNNLVSIDAVEEFRVQTSTYAPEFGRQPGGQISIVTRSGANEFHGTLFNYLRNDKLDATDWFANRAGLEKPALRQNDFGGVVGGPIIKDRTFFFFSYEGLRLRQPKTAIKVVPSVNARQIAPAQMKPFLDAFPLPNGADLGGEMAEFSATYSDPADLNATSIRIDHAVSSKLTLFGRYNHAPSGIDQRGPGAWSANNVDGLQFKTQTLTLGATLGITPTITNDFRGNWSRSRGTATLVVDDFGGAVPPPDSLLFQAPFASSVDSQLQLIILGGPFFRAGANAANVQRQLNFVDTLSIVTGSHQLRFGIDYRRLTPIFNAIKYAQAPFFLGVLGALTGNTLQTVIIATPGPTYPVFTNLSAFAQDTWNATPRLTLTYGLRWEYNPPPTEQRGNDAFTVVGLDDPATMTLAPRGTPLWKATYDNFAPRVGVAYMLSQSQNTVLRGGFGLFYGLGNGQASIGFTNSFPFVATKFLFGVPFPLDPALAAPPSFSLDPPFFRVGVFDPNLKLPYSAQWNLALEKSLGPNQSISVSYLAAVGRRLLRQELLLNPNPDFTQVFATKNKATADYHALQVQFQRRLSRGLQVLASYTWGHAIDTVSDDSSLNVPAQRIDVDQERGSSNFDVRHSFTAAVTYDISTPAVADAARVILRNWSVDTIVRARTATPINIITGTDPLGVGQRDLIRPDLVPGVPIWIDDPSVGGGRRLNSNAFSIPVAARQGTLGRNVLRGFGVSQVDFAIRRQFDLTERFKLQFRAEFFNLFNYANFGDPVTNLSSALFGQSTQMLARDLGSGGIGGGLSSLYQVGGPRSIQLALKFLF